MWHKTGDRFNELIEKLTEALTNRQSDPLLIQHLGDCVRRQDKIETALESQREASLNMHNENRLARERDNRAATTRFISLLLLLLGGMIAPYATGLFRGLHGG